MQVVERGRKQNQEGVWAWPLVHEAVEDREAMQRAFAEVDDMAEKGMRLLRTLVCPPLYWPPHCATEAPASAILSGGSA
jgi:hypothetical protein